MLERLVLAAIPDNLASQCRFGGCRNGELILIATNSTQASQLRFHQRAILPRLREHEAFSQVWRIRVRVAHWHGGAPRSNRERPTLSIKNARLLEEVAGHTEDQGLRTILLRLASRAEGGGDSDPTQ